MIPTHIYKLKRRCPSNKPDNCVSMNIQTLLVQQVITANQLNKQGIKEFQLDAEK